MTYTEIIKALGKDMDLIDLINRQQAEIEALKTENQSLRSAANSYKLHYNKARTEAVKEFAEKLKESITDCHTVSDGEYVGYDWTDITHCIDNLVKEMVGED